MEDNCIFCSFVCSVRGPQWVFTPVNVVHNYVAEFRNWPLYTDPMLLLLLF